MVPARWFGRFVLALAFVPSLAAADEALVGRVRHGVEEALLKPLTEKENHRGKFSRARMPPKERRVRVNETDAATDARGRDYVPFSVDERYAADWNENVIVGCSYPTTNELFVKIGESFYVAAVILGGKGGAVTGVCTPPPKS